MSCNTSNIPYIEKSLLETPQKPVEKPPLENIVTILEHIVKVRRRRTPLLNKLKLLTDKNDISNLIQIEEIEKIEEEIEFINKYTQNLQNQAVVIMNEHDVKNIPLLEDIEKRLPYNENDNEIL
jgi:hypothetical protein